MMNDRHRIVYFDILRILSVVAVMLVHTSVQNWDSVDVKSIEWQTMNGFRSLSTFGVPSFVMISGALFLNRKKALKQIVSKNIKRIVIAFVFWSLIYAVYIYFQMGRIDALINAFLGGHYHMWFLFMIVGLYLIVPFLYPIVNSVKLTKYYILYIIVFNICHSFTSVYRFASF